MVKERFEREKPSACWGGALRSNEQTILSTAESLVRFGLLGAAQQAA
jgi:hypothetical protein